VSKAVSNFLFYVTFSANFFLYCLSGDRFRTTLRRVLRHWFCCEPHDARSLTFTATSRKSATETHQQRTLTSSLACTTGPALPNTVNNSQLNPVGPDAGTSSKAEETEGLTNVTAFTGQQQTDEGGAVVEFRPKNPSRVDDGPAA